MNKEQKAVETILERGVKFTIPVPFWLRPVIWKKQVSFTIRQPYLGTIMMISSQFLKMEIDPTALEGLTMHQGIELFSRHGKAMSRIAATGILNSFWLRWLIGPLAWLIRWGLTPHKLYQLFYLLITFSGVQDFTSTIRLTAAMKITEPKKDNQSQENQGS